MNINFDELLSAGTEYRSSAFEFYSRYHGGVCITHANKDAYDRFWSMRRDERVVDMLAWVLRIPQNVIINAARIENRYYERGGEGCIDSARLIRGLLKNSNWLEKDAL